MAIAIGEIRENLKGEIEKISKERKYRVKVTGEIYKVILHPDLEVVAEKKLKGPPYKWQESII